MKRSNIPLRMIRDVVCSCIVLHNLCITMKDAFDKTWIDEAESELVGKVANGEAREGSEVRGARAAIEEVRSKIQCRQNLVVEDVVDEKLKLFLLKKMRRPQICFGKQQTCTKLWLQACGKPNFMHLIIVAILILIQILTNRVVRISLASLQNFYPCSSTNPLITEMRK